MPSELVETLDPPLQSKEKRFTETNDARICTKVVELTKVGLTDLLLTGLATGERIDSVKSNERIFRSCSSPVHWLNLRMIVIKCSACDVFAYVYVNKYPVRYSYDLS